MFYIKMIGWSFIENYLEKIAFFFLSDRSDFHLTDSLSITYHAFTRRVVMSFSVDETLLLR